MKLLKRNAEDLIRMLSVFLFNLLATLALIPYYKTELAMASELVSKEIIKRNEILNTNFVLNSGIVGAVADKIAFLGVVLIVITILSSCYIGMTYNKFIPGLISVILNTIMACMILYIPIKHNNIEYETIFGYIMYGSIVLSGIISYIILKIMSLALRFIILGSTRPRNDDPYDDSDDDTEDDLWDDNSNNSWRGVDKQKQRKKRKSNKKKRKTSKRLSKMDKEADWDYSDVYSDEDIDYDYIENQTKQYKKPEETSGKVSIIAQNLR